MMPRKGKTTDERNHYLTARVLGRPSTARFRINPSDYGETVPVPPSVDKGRLKVDLFEMAERRREYRDPASTDEFMRLLRAAYERGWSAGDTARITRMTPSAIHVYYRKFSRSEKV